MSIYKGRQISNLRASDDTQLFVIRRDFSGGTNTRQHASKILDTQVETLENWDISVMGETRKIPGTVLVEDLGNNAGTGAFGYEPRGGTNELLVTHGTSLSGTTDGAAFTSPAHKTNFTTDLQTTMIKATCSGGVGDVVLISNGTDHVWEMTSAHAFNDCGDSNTTPPLTKVMAFFRNRVWTLKANVLNWSGALPATYAAGWDRATNAFNMTVGEERALIGVRDTGLLALGADAVYGINPSVTPVATDKPEKILDIGCVANKTAVQVADDVLFLSSDGVRGVFRTQQDKLQMGQSFPLSFNLKAEFERISWNSISKACAIYFDNKYLLALPVDSSTYNNQVWVFYPSSQSWTVIEGWNVGAWGTVKFSGEERLYYIDSNDGSVYRAFSGYDNNDVAITGTIICREEDMGQPLKYKIGGEVEIEVEVAGSDDTLAIQIAIDGGDFRTLGTVSLDSPNAPTLPVTLPFTLADSYIVRQKFHLESFGRWRTIQLKMVNSDLNVDPIIIYGYSIVTFPEEYINE